MSQAVPADLAGTGWRSLSSFDRQEFLSRNLPGLPITPGVGSALVLSHYARGGFTACQELAVVMVSQERKQCLAVVEAPKTSWNVLRFEPAHNRAVRKKGESPAPPRARASAPYAAEADGLDEAALKKLPRAALEWAPRAHEDYIPKKRMRLEASGFFATFRQHEDAMSRELAPIFRRAATAGQGAVTLMATNAGMVDLIANWLCAARAPGPESASLQRAAASVVVFASDAATRAALAALGVGAAYHHQGLGELPTESAGNYGDFTFVRMMWLKVTSVYLANAAGHDVLFQDADVVWLRDPLAYFREAADPAVDSFWMDDGARTIRCASRRAAFARDSREDS